MGLKTKISCFFSSFFCLNPLRLECSKMRKTASFQTSHRLRRNTKIYIHKMLKSANFWRETASFYQFMKTVSMFYVFSLILDSTFFTACFYHFLFWRYLPLSMTSFSLDILLPLPILNDLNSREKHTTRYLVVQILLVSEKFKSFIFLL